MPSKIQKRLESQLKTKGYSTKSAIAISTSTLQKAGDLKKGSNQPTAKGIKRGNMTPAARAKDRQAKYSEGKHKAYDFAYTEKTNTATLNPKFAKMIATTKRKKK